MKERYYEVCDLYVLIEVLGVEELTWRECETVGNSGNLLYVRGREAYKEPEIELSATMKIRRMYVPDARKSQVSRRQKGLAISNIDMWVSKMRTEKHLLHLTIKKLLLILLSCCFIGMIVVRSQIAGGRGVKVGGKLEGVSIGNFLP